MKKYNLIFLDDSMLLSKKEYKGWKDIQYEFDNYKASLEFDSLESIKEYMKLDYKLSDEELNKIIDPINNSKENYLELKF